MHANYRKVYYDNSDDTFVIQVIGTGYAYKEPGWAQILVTQKKGEVVLWQDANFDKRPGDPRVRRPLPMSIAR